MTEHIKGAHNDVDHDSNARHLNRRQKDLLSTTINAMKLRTRRKKKEKSDADLYRPPTIGVPSANEQQQQMPTSPQHPAGYRAALQAYAHTISPLESNEDGFGGSATLRSRSTKSGGKKHRTLIPVMYSPTSSEATVDRYSFSYDQMGERVEVREREWSAIPEEPRSPGEMKDDYGGNHDNLSTNDDEQSPTYNNEQQEQVIGQSSSEAPSEQRTRSAASSEIRTVGPVPTISISPMNQPRPSTDDTPTSHQSHHPTIRQSTKESHKPNLTLQPSPIYEEHYGDAYIDSHIKYLYPTGYTSMRPRSGPFKLSIFVFGLFLWLSVFIVGHCYDRGRETYPISNADDAYLADVDDDTLVMETRWCGSKLLYVMWFICVSITMLALSYCSVIGYIKLRDVAVANGRSQPSSSGGGRNDCYVNLMDVENATSVVGSSVVSSEEGSYQKGRRYPSIYQSDGTPQFWGGHIYRPTQAAVSMTNR